MKKNIAINTKLSVGALFLIFVFDVFLKNSTFTYYYFTVFYFFGIYVTQAIFLSKFSNTPTRFHLIYAVTTLLKILVSLALLATYYLFIEDFNEPTQKHKFAIFYIIIYFIYLIANTKSFFVNTK